MPWHNQSTSPNYIQPPVRFRWRNRLLLVCILLTVLIGWVGTQSLPVFASISPTIEKEVVGERTTFAAGEEFTYLVTVECNVTAQGEGCDNFILQDVLPTFTDVKGNTSQLEFVTATSSVQLGNPVEQPDGTISYDGGLPGGSATSVEITVRFPSGITPNGTAVVNEALFGPNDGAGNPNPNDPLTVSDQAESVSATAQPSQLETRKSVRSKSPYRVNEPVSYRAEICSLGNPQGGSLIVELDNAQLVDTLPAGAIVTSAGGGAVVDNVITWNLGNVTIEPGKCISRDYKVVYPSNHPDAPTENAPFQPEQMVTNNVVGSGTIRGPGNGPFQDDASTTITLAIPEPPRASGKVDKQVSRRYVDLDRLDNADGTGDEGDSLFYFKIKGESTGNQPLDDVIISDDLPAEFVATELRLSSWTGGSQATVTVTSNAGQQSFGPFDSNPAPIDLSGLTNVTRIEINYGSVPDDWKTGEVRLYGYAINPDRSDNTYTLPHRFDNVSRLTADAPGNLPDVNTSEDTYVIVESPRPAPAIKKRNKSASTVDPTFGADISRVTWEIELSNPGSATDGMPQPILADIVPPPLTYVAGSARVHNAPGAVGTPVIVEPADSSTGGTIRWEFPGTLELNQKIYVRFETQVPDAEPPKTIRNDGYATTNALPADAIRWNPQDDVGDIDGDGDETDQRIRDDDKVTIRAVPGINSQKRVQGPDDADYVQNTTSRPGAQVDWQLTVSNVGNVGLEEVSVIELLPRVGDRFVNQPGVQRNTQWQPNLVGAVTGEGFRVEYTTAANPCRPKLPTGCDQPNWSTTLPVDITTVRAMRITFIGDLGDGDGILPAGQSISFTWPMRAPTNAPVDELAINSFAWFGTAVGTGKAISAEPPPVTVRIEGEPLPNLLGNFVFRDLNFNGLQDGGEEIGVSGVRLELWRDNDNGVFGPLDTFLGFTLTDPETGVLGQYLFEDRPDGNYFLVMVPPPGVQVTFPNRGDGDDGDSDFFWDPEDNVWRTEQINLDADGLEESTFDTSWDAGLFALLPAIRLQKATNGLDSDEPTGAFIPVDDAVTWTYEVRNTGNMILDNVSVVDDQAVPVTCPLTTLYPSFLDPASEDFIPDHPLFDETGASTMTCTVDQAFAAQLGQYANVGRVTANPRAVPVADPSAPPVDETFPAEVRDDDPSHYYGAQPSIDLEKATNEVDADTAAAGPFVPAGGNVEWMYVIRNTGNTTLINVTLSDSVETIDGEMACDQDYPARLEPGEAMTCLVEGEAIEGQYRNDSFVIGTPVDSEDRPYYSGNDVRDDDPSHYFGARPAIDVEKTTNSVQSDEPTGQVIRTDDAVMWTYTVVNTGNVALANVTVGDDVIGDVTASCVDGAGGAKTQPLLLAAGESVTCSATGAAAAGQYANVVVAAGDPADATGTPLAGFTPVVDDDPSHYLGATPGIELQKTVYRGDDAGASCPGDELVTDLNGTAVTYCFVVTNTGDTFLDDVRLDDETLGIDKAAMTLLSGSTPLTPSASLTYVYTDTISGDLTNIAEVVANPTDGEGNDLPGAPNPTDSDDAQVDQVGPGIDLDKTVYFGHESDGSSEGATCPGSDLLRSAPDAPITYCFVVTNTGDTDLISTVITDADLGALLPVGDLAVGESKTVAFEETLDVDLVNLAEVVAVPVDTLGVPIPDVQVRDEDEAEVQTAAPAVRIEKTVYLGRNDGDACPGDETVIGTPGTSVTYCFRVTNTGDTYLNTVVISDSDLGITLTSDLLLAPQESVTLHSNAVIIDDLLNTASVSANPANGDGDDLPGVDDVTDDDTAAVDKVLPAIALRKTVYAGRDGGASCEGDELEIGISGTQVTYCFVATNTGDTFLSSLILADSDLGLAPADFIPLDPAASGTPLAPGAKRAFYVETAISSDLLNTAEVTGNPSDETGGDLTGVDDVTDDDTAAVDVVGPSIELRKTVYLGHNGGESCAGTELVAGAIDDLLTYCFEVTNTGDTFLNEVELNDVQLAITQAEMTQIDGNVPLAPNARLRFFYETTLSDDLVNTATVVATPSDEGGMVLPNTPQQTDDDDAEVTLIPPGIALAKTVYAGQDGGASCPGGELVNDVARTLVTYCFIVTNTGGTFLADLALSDPALDINQDDLTRLSGDLPLAPGATVVYFYQTTIRGDLPNEANVSGTPSDATGTPLPDQPQPTDKDTAAVDEQPTLELSKAVDPPSLPEPGGLFRFTVLITNTSSSPLTLTSLADEPYGDLTGVSASANASVVASTCKLVTIQPGDTYRCQFSVDITGVEGDRFIDTVTTVGQAPDGDSAQASDDAEVTLDPPPGTPDVRATKRDALQVDLNENGEFDPGDTIRYTIAITNVGDGPGVFTLLQDVPDPNVTLVAGSVRASKGAITRGNEPGDERVEVSLGTLEPDETAQIVFDVVINDPLPEGLMQIENRAEISFADPSDSSSSGSDVALTDDPDTPTPDDSTLSPLPATPTAIQLATFSVVVRDGVVELRWVAALEVDTWGYHIWRSADGRRENAVRLTESPILAGSAADGIYIFVDESVELEVKPREEMRTYTYWLQEVGLDGSLRDSGAVRLTVGGESIFLPLIGR